MSILFAFLSGLLFGIGLLLSGLASPTKVLAFLDLAGAWDPTLALVMVGAVLVGAVGFYWTRRRSLSLLGLPLQLPVATRLDRRLAIGSLLFGAGWGLAGICPGPAVVLLGTGTPAAWIFFAALLAGMVLFELIDRLPRLVPQTKGA